RERRFLRVREKGQVNERGDDSPPGDVNHRAVFRESRVQGRERMRVIRRVAGEVGLDDWRTLPQRLGKTDDAGSAGQLSQARARWLVPAVFENQEMARFGSQSAREQRLGG